MEDENSEIKSKPSRSRQPLSKEAQLRNRESQARSRRNKQELITQLKNENEQLRKEGVRATVEVQNVAKKLVDENMELRALLHRLMDENQVLKDVIRERDVRIMNGNEGGHRGHRRVMSEMMGMDVDRNGEMDMSCEEAAGIIAGMRMGCERDTQMVVREELGCLGERDCVVERAKVLELMGRD